LKICKICLQSDFLCSGCSSKLENNQITKTDVAIERALYNIAKDQKKFDADFLKSIELPEKVIILVDRKHVGSIIGKAGNNIVKLEKTLGKKVKVLEYTNDEKEMIKNIVGAPILAINKLYEKEESIKVRIERRYEKRVDKSAGEIIKNVIGKHASIVFE
jgi:transcription antitermination factor NusA-like protein